MLKAIAFAFYLFLISIILLGCSGTGKTDNQADVLADINGEKITAQDLYSNPGFQQMLQQIIYEKIIKQEFEVRKLKLDNNRVTAEWDKFVQSQGGDENVANENLKKQGINKDFVIAQLKTKIMLEDIIFQEKPLTMDDAKKEFESNLEANKKMYAMNIPEKKDKPETVTFDDVADKVLDTLKQRQFSMEAQNTIDTLYNKYVENGWLTNFVKPAEKKEITKIEKPREETTQIDPSQMRKAPMKSGDKGEKPAGKTGD